MDTIHEINQEIEKLIKEIRALDRVFFNVDKKYSYKLKVEKDKMWNKIKFLKIMKKIQIMKK